MNCRHCQSVLSLSLIDLGSAPPSNAYLTQEQLSLPESHFPLRVLVCENCWLVQTAEFSGQLFPADYAYFSSGAKGWLEHAERYVEEAVTRFNLSPSSLVVEVAANDGYLLQYVRARQIPCLGIEPTHLTAEAARGKGIPILERFFNSRVAQVMVADGKQADLLIANNVLAHVPDINDFVLAFSILLKPDGVATFEFPHLLRLVAGCQFDTIYHEHFSYLSLTVVERIFAANGLSIFAVEEHETHGGSLRVFAQRRDTGRRPCNRRVITMLDCERLAGLTSADFYYSTFQSRAEKIKDEFLQFLINAKRGKGRSVVGYGAAAKGTTLLNYAGVRPDLLPFVADITLAKQGKFLPGCRIPVVGEAALRAARPAYVVILPWNWREEAMRRIEFVREWGGKFVVAVPRLEVI
jgi:SAM-dependent methyltransferase